MTIQQGNNTLSTNSAGTNIHMQKNDVKTFMPHHIKNSIKMDKRPKL